LMRGGYGARNNSGILVCKGGACMRWQMTEELMASIWQQGLVTSLLTDTGQELTIIYPGRRNFSIGSDFTGGIFSVDGEIIEGDVEVHVASSQWYSHGHHRDPRYNRVILHVVWYSDVYCPARLRNGKAVFTVALCQSFNTILEELSWGSKTIGGSLPMCPESYSVPVLGLLTLLGEERFFGRVTSFEQMLTQCEANQLLFRSVSRALGYAENSVPFARLADSLTINTLEAYRGVDDIKRRALLLGFAGLLPSQRLYNKRLSVEDDETKRLEMIWRREGNESYLNEGDWCFFRARPDNFPPRRLVALSGLLSRYNECGLLGGVLSLVWGESSEAEHRRIEEGLIVRDEGYWGNHIDFGVVKARRSALLGRERAAEIVVNVALPFVFAWGEMFGEMSLSDRAFGVFQRYGGLGENKITRHMRQQLGIAPQLRLSASQHQGLIHLFKTYCHRRNCACCPLTSSVRDLELHLSHNG